MSTISQIEIIAFIAQTALTYIFIQIATGNAQKQTITDQKTDLRTTKEDLMGELKDSRETLLRESQISTASIIDLIKIEFSKQNNKEKD